VVERGGHVHELIELREALFAFDPGAEVLDGSNPRDIGRQPGETRRAGRTISHAREENGLRCLGPPCLRRNLLEIKAAPARAARRSPAPPLRQAPWKGPHRRSRLCSPRPVHRKSTPLEHGDGDGENRRRVQYP